LAILFHVIPKQAAKKHNFRFGGTDPSMRCA